MAATAPRLSTVNGIIVVSPGPWADQGILRGDVIYQVNGSGVNGGEELQQIEKLRFEGAVKLSILRAGKAIVLWLEQKKTG